MTMENSGLKRLSHSQPREPKQRVFISGTHCYSGMDEKEREIINKRVTHTAYFSMSK